MKWPSPIAAAAVTSLLALLAYSQGAVQTYKVGVELVQFHATVTDAQGRYVRDLKREHFEVSEDGVEQKIDTFSSDDVPLSVGIILDVSGTMKPNLPLVKEGAMAFLSAGNLDNEYFLVEFNDKAQVTENFTHDLLTLRNHDKFLPSGRNKAVYDGIFLGLNKLHDGLKPRKVLLVLTTGGELASEHTAAQVRNLAREMDAEIFSVDLPPDFDVHGEIPQAKETTENIIVPLGGRNFVATSGTDYLNICRRIAVSLRNEYDLTYHSTNATHDGKYRRIQVKLHPPKGAPELFVQARDGYYAPEP